MTLELLDKANAYVKRIDRLKKVHDIIRNTVVGMDSSLVRMTDFDICGPGNFKENINQGELIFLLEAYGNEIKRLEGELEEL